MQGLPVGKFEEKSKNSVDASETEFHALHDGIMIMKLSWITSELESPKKIYVAANGGKNNKKYTEQPFLAVSRMATLELRKKAEIYVKGLWWGYQTKTERSSYLQNSRYDGC